jgi:hypothetical protein
MSDEGTPARRQLAFPTPVTTPGVGTVVVWVGTWRDVDDVYVPPWAPADRLAGGPAGPERNAILAGSWLTEGRIDRAH